MWHCLGIGLTAFSLLLNIVGLAIPYWYYETAHLDGGWTRRAYFGLWETCGSRIRDPWGPSIPCIGK